MKTQSSAKRFETIRLSAEFFLTMTLWLLLCAPAFALTINLVAVDGNGAPVPVPTGYRWTVEEDRTKLPNPGQLSTRANQSLSFHTSYMPVVAAGRVGAPGVASTADPDVARLYAQTPDAVSLDANKRYYVSVAAQGFQIGGAPVVFGASGATATVTLIAYPVPTAQLSVLVFEDNSPVNSTAELPAEKGLEGFTVQLLEAGGTYGASGGQVTQDAFGNPLGTTYSDDAGTVLQRGTGIILTDANGVAVIKNLYPAKYTVYIAPRIRPGEDWHQTSTIEGTKGIDAWVKNNEPPGFYEFGPPGYHVFYGFVNAGNSGCLQGKNGATCVGMGTAATPGQPITGRIVAAHDARPPALTIDQGPPVPQCWVALNNSATSQGLYAAPCNKDSTFTIPNVLPGTYQLVVWDEPLDTIIGFSTVTVGSAPVVLGDVTQLNWFGRYQGRVFQDIDGTGLPYFVADYNRPYVYVNPVTGVEEERQQNFKAGDLKPALGAGVASNIRFRDGSIYQSTTTKDDGTFAFTEVFPFFNWTVAEIDYARFKASSANIVVDNGGPINKADNLSKLWGKNPTTPYTGLFGSGDPALAYDPWARINPQPQRLIDGALTEGGAFRTENCGETGQCAILLEGMSLYGNQTNHIEWGKTPYKITENGGIAGIVYYGITRAEDDPRYATAENWEPGIPRVQVNVFLDCDGDGKVDKPKNDGTGQCAAGSLSGANSYSYDPPDVDNYPFCWRDPASCGYGSPQKGPEDVKRSRTGDANTFSYGDVFRWGAPATELLPNPLPGDQPEIGLGKTDAWDDSIPTDCLTRSLTEPKFTIPYGPDAGTSPDCWDGFRNWNQLRPSVFDGGYAFGRVAGQAELPMIIGAEAKGTYIVEAVAPPGYLHQGNGDKNVTFGDELASRPAALPHECVGIDLPVPQFLTLFEGIQEPNPNYTGPGQTWRKCDMKAVPLQPGMNAAPNFFLFTEAPVAAHGVGLLTDDLNNTFDPLSPNWGEKYAPPYVPISIQDWQGREIQRTYSDQYGRYNFLVPSTFTINPPYPSGVMPNMLQACLNHPGPISKDPNTGVAYAAPQIDPYFSRRYTQQCYTLQYLPGKTTYLDTPMLPVSAFASVEKTPLDCECENKTPGIYSVTNGGNGPWVSGSGGTLTIVSNGVVEVPNPAFDPAAVQDPTPGAAINPKTLRTIKRDYGFGATQGAGNVTLNGTPLTITNWADGVITATVPSGASSGQLMVKRGDNGKESVIGLTVHVGGLSAPKTVPSATFPTIQAAINAAANGDLITIAPGNYNEALILDKRVRLQGWGAGSTYVNPIIKTGPAPVEWRALLNAKATAGSFTMLPGQGLGVDQIGLPLLLGSEEQSGVLVLGKKGSSPGVECENAGFALRIDGLSITGGITGGGILANGYACNLQISNNRVFSNSGSFGGGVRIGHTTLVAGTAYVDAVNRNVRLHHNWIAENGALAIGAGGGQSGGGGGITLGTGSDGYRVDNNFVCGNFSLSDGAGMSHLGQSNAGSIVGNKFVFNQSFAGGFSPRGAGLSIAAQLATAGGAAQGAGDVTVNANLFQGNQAGAGAGGAVSIANTLPGDDVVLTNNMVINNVTGYAGAVALSGNTGNVRLVNNTVASNVSTATTQQAFAAVLGQPTTPQIAGVAVIDGNAPILLNNILWGNRSYIFVTGTTSTALCNPGATGLTAAGACSPAGTASYRDLGAVTPPANGLEPRYSVFTDTTANRAAFTGSNNGTCSATDPALGTNFRCNQFAAETSGAALFLNPNTFTGTLQSAVTVDEGGNYVNVIYSPLTLWDISPTGAILPTLFADYRLAGGAVAINNGRNNSNRTLSNDALIGANSVPGTDIEDQVRTATRVDIGADEANAAAALKVVAPNPAAFGTVSVNTNKTIVLTVSNLGTTSLPLDATVATITGSGAFTVASETCGTSLAPDESCTIDVRFAPTANGAQSATLNVNGAPVVAVALSGTGVTPVYTITPGALAGHGFGNQLVLTQSAPFQFTLTNTAASLGGELWLNGNPTLTGPVLGTNYSSQFQAAFRPGDTCTATTRLATGASCTFSVVFAPTSTGNKGTSALLPGARAGVSVVSGAGLPSPVWGTGIAPVSFTGESGPGAFNAAGTTLAFGNLSGNQTNTLTLTINAAVTFGTATVSNGTPAAFSKGADTCSGSSFVAGNTCTITVNFSAPTTTSSRTGTLSVPYTGAAGSPATLSLTGS